MKPDTPPQTKVQYTEPVLPGQDPHITHEDTIPFSALIGTIRRTTHTPYPEWTPTGKGLDQFALQEDGLGDRIFYIYDFKNNQWYGTSLST